jgi:hypothetical protein
MPLGANFLQGGVKYIQFPINSSKKSSINNNGKLLPSYRISFQSYSNYAANESNATSANKPRGQRTAQVNTNAKIAAYVAKRKSGATKSGKPLTFLFNNMYPVLYTIYEVVNQNGSFPNNSWLQKGVQALSSTNGGVSGIRSQLINGKSRNNKRKKILSNFLTRYASNKPV